MKTYIERELDYYKEHSKRNEKVRIEVERENIKLRRDYRELKQDNDRLNEYIEFLENTTGKLDDTERLYHELPETFETKDVYRIAKEKYNKFGNSKVDKVLKYWLDNNRIEKEKKGIYIKHD